MTPPFIHSQLHFISFHLIKTRVLIKFNSGDFGSYAQDQPIYFIYKFLVTLEITHK